MEWKIEEVEDKNRFFIVLIIHDHLDWDYLCFDSEIAKKFGITTKQYRKELKQFGAYKYKEIFFKERFQAYLALEYLKEKYGILLKLTN